MWDGADEVAVEVQCSWEDSKRVRSSCRSICGERGEQVLKRECVCERERQVFTVLKR